MLPGYDEEKHQAFGHSVAVDMRRAEWMDPLSKFSNSDPWDKLPSLYWVLLWCTGRMSHPLTNYPRSTRSTRSKSQGKVRMEEGESWRHPGNVSSYQGLRYLINMEQLRFICLGWLLSHATGKNAESFGP